MTFEECWKQFSEACPLDIEDREIAQWMWDAAFREGVKYALSMDSRDVTLTKIKLNKEGL